MPGRPDWAGVPLVHGIDILANNFGVNMAAGQTVAFPGFQVNRPGYLLNLQAVYTGANGNNPLCSMDVAWYDNGQNARFGHEAWRIPAGSNGNGYFHTGRGPTKGQLLVLSFTNRDLTQPMQAVFWLAQTTQHASRDDIRLHVGGVSPVFTDAPGFDPTYNRLANFQGQAVLAGQTLKFLLPLYSGQAQLVWGATGQSAANVVSVQIMQADALTSFDPDYSLLAGASPFQSPNAQLVTLPRKVCFIVVSNSGTSTANVTLSMVAQEYSS